MTDEQKIKQAIKDWQESVDFATKEKNVSEIRQFLYNKNTLYGFCSYFSFKPYLSFKDGAIPKEIQKAINKSNKFYLFPVANFSARKEEIIEILNLRLNFLKQLLEDGKI